jgi:hypothetical protein
MKTGDKVVVNKDLRHSATDRVFSSVEQMRDFQRDQSVGVITSIVGNKVVVRFGEDDFTWNFHKDDISLSAQKIERGQQFIIKKVDGVDEIHGVKYGTVVTIEQDFDEGETYVEVVGVHITGRITHQTVPREELHEIATGKPIVEPTPKFQVGEIVEVVSSGAGHNVPIGERTFILEVHDEDRAVVWNRTGKGRSDHKQSVPFHCLKSTTFMFNQTDKF